MPRKPAEFITAVLATVQKATDAGDNSRLEADLQTLIDAGVTAGSDSAVSKDAFEFDEWGAAEPDWWETAAAGDDREIVALKIQVTIDKASILPAERKVWGWASVTERNGVPVVDVQHDVIESAEMQRAVHDWIMSDGPTNGIPARRMGDSHLRIGIGKICDSIFFTDDIKKALNIADRVSNTGWYIGAHIDDDATWAKVESGQLSAFSIGARALREAMA